MNIKLFLALGLFFGSALTASAQFADQGAYDKYCNPASPSYNSFICTNAMVGMGGSGNNTGSNQSAPCTPSNQPVTGGTQSGWTTKEQLKAEGTTYPPALRAFSAQAGNTASQKQITAQTGVKGPAALPEQVGYALTREGITPENAATRGFMPTNTAQTGIKGPAAPAGQAGYALIGGVKAGDNPAVRAYMPSPTTRRATPTASTGNAVSRAWNSLTSALFGPSFKAPSQDELNKTQKQNVNACMAGHERACTCVVMKNRIEIYDPRVDRCVPLNFFNNGVNTR